MSAARCWDTVVIGAGVSGAIAAQQLAERGLAVLLVDKARFPRPKVCGGCLNSAAVAHLDQLGLGSLLRRLAAEPLREIHIECSGRRACLSLAGGAAVSRTALDAALVDAAIASGAVFLPGVTARIGRYAGATRELDLVCTEGKLSLAAQSVVVASGLHGDKLADDDLLRSVPAVGSRIGAGVVLDGAPAGFEAGIVRMAVDARGYVGAVRVEQGRLSVAAALDRRCLHSGKSPAAVVGAIATEAGWPWPAAAADLQWLAAPQLTRRPPQVCGRRLFLVGDAAGYVEPFTGEGMAWAIAGARALAPIVAEVVGHTLDPNGGDWSRTHRRLLGRSLAVCGIVSHMLRRPRLVGAALAGLTWFPALAMPWTGH